MEEERHWLIAELENRGYKFDNSTDYGPQLSDFFKEHPLIFSEIIRNRSKKEYIGFTEISQSIFSSDIDLKIIYSNSDYFINNINGSLPELIDIYPNIYKKITNNINVAFMISSLIDSYRNKKVGLLYIPGFHRSLYGPFGKDILPHVIPLLSDKKDNLNIEYPGNGFIRMSWDVFAFKEDIEFKDQFDAEEYEFLIYLLLKFCAHIETIFAHSLGPIFIIEALKKLEKEVGVNNKIGKIIFLNPALNQEKLSKFWFIQNFLDEKDQPKQKDNIKNIQKHLEAKMYRKMKFSEKIKLKSKIQVFLDSLNKKNSSWFDFLSLFFDENGDNFILEEYLEWKKWVKNNNLSYVKYAFSRNFIIDYDNLSEEILNKTAIISLEGYSTVPFDSLRNSQLYNGVKTMIIYIPKETHYANSEKEVLELKRVFERL